MRKSMATISASTLAGSAVSGSTLCLAPDAAGIARAAQILRRGGLVAFPTETVYGLGADATQAMAVAALYAAKQRPSFNPLIAHVADLAAARREGVFDAAALTLANAFWPGPLTLVVPKAVTCRVCDLALAGLGSVALRVPAHRIAHALIAAAGVPVAAPSANRSGHVSPTRAEHVLTDLAGRIDAIVEGGAAEVGLESTIVACLDGEVTLLRPGGLPREAIAAVLGRPLRVGGDPAAMPGPARPSPLAPGMLASHYAPRAEVRLGAAHVEEGEAALLFGSAEPPGLGRAVAALNLSEAGNLAEAAANLFSHMRALDASGARAIAVVPIPEDGLGEAINDRLRRAAAPK
jgi:L-threonylcarbamoyladenylate synthase